MSNKSTGVIEETSDTRPELSNSQSLGFTVENLQRHLRELHPGHEKRLYGSSEAVEAYITNLRHQGQVTDASQDWNSPEGILSKYTNTLASCERVEILGRDGVVITRLSRPTQTDWEWVSHQASFDLGVVAKPSVSRPTEMDIQMIPPPETDAYEELHIEGLVDVEAVEQEHIATKSRTLQVSSQAELLTGKSDKIPLGTCSIVQCGRGAESDLLHVVCEYCGQERRVVGDQEQRGRDPDLEEGAWRTSKHLREEEEEKDKALEVVQEIAKINEVKSPPLGKTDCNAREEPRPVELDLTKFHIFNPPGSFIKTRTKYVPKNSICYRLSNESWSHPEVPQFPEMEIITPPETLILPDRPAGVKRKNILIRYYKNGKTFILIFPDGTGHVFYPSGRAAIVISSVHQGHYIYIILEDAALMPNIQAIFTSKGQATCYHPNGIASVNLTRLGGTWCFESGALRRQWSWLDLSVHVHAPPFQPITITPSPNICIRICTQEKIDLTFTAGRKSVRFNMGTKLKVEDTKGLILPGIDSQQSYLQTRKSDISSLLQKLRSSTSFAQVDLGPNKAYYSLVAQGQRYRSQEKKKKAVKKTKLPKLFKQMKLLVGTKKSNQTEQTITST